jgi:hypothetical protein
MGADEEVEADSVPLSLSESVGVRNPETPSSGGLLEG